MDSSPYLVIGASGTVGSELVRLLAAAGHRVRALTRNPDKLTKLPSGVQIVAGDLSQLESLPAAFAGASRVFLATNGPWIASLEAAAVDMARQQGAERIVKLSGRHLEESCWADRGLAKRHSDSENHLRQSGVPWTIVRAGLFASNVLLWRVREQGGLHLPVGDGRDTPTDPRDLAAVAFEALTAPGHAGRTYEITGPEYLTYPEMVDRLSRATGRRLTFSDIPAEALCVGLEAAGVPAAQAGSTLDYFAMVRGGLIYPPTATAQTVLGRPARRFADWVRDHLTLLK
jgi:uncharacterized protein YbjT (DUF2867 family)